MGSERRDRCMMASRYAADRDAAFCAFVEDGDWSHIDALMDRHGIPRVPHKPTAEAGIYLAIQECLHIPAEVKEEAYAKYRDLRSTWRRERV